MIDTNLGISFAKNQLFNGNLSMTTADIRIEVLQQEDVEAVTLMIRSNLEEYEEHGSVLAATFRRLTDILGVYGPEGRKLFVARDMTRDGACIGCAGTGSFHGLPVSEGVAEIRDLVVETAYRGKGIGSKLLSRCLEEVRTIGYQRVYLETTPQMKLAQKLFMRNGFRPVVEGGKAASPEDPVPCYFVKEDVQTADN